jgi:hypothetical protein
VQQSPKSPWYRQVWLVILVVVIVLSAAGATLGWQALRKTDGAKAGPRPPSSTQRHWSEGEEPTTTRAATTTIRADPGVLWERTGRESDYGTPFEAPDRWRIIWSYDCRNFVKYGGGNFKIVTEGSLKRLSVEDFGVRNSGVRPVTGAGRGRLVVSSVCRRWTVKVVAS